MDTEDLPGFEVVDQGLRDLSEGRVTVPGCLVSIGGPRLRRLGLTVPPTAVPSPEHQLYELLTRASGDAAHGMYNALLRRLVSFERAAECVG